MIIGTRLRHPIFAPLSTCSVLDSRYSWRRFASTMSKHPEDGASGHSSHEERTAAAPRESSLHAVTVNHIGDVGNVRRLRLDILDRQRGIKVRPRLHLSGLE